MKFFMTYTVTTNVGKKCVCDSLATAIDHIKECFDEDDITAMGIVKEMMSQDRFEKLKEFESND